MRFSQKLILIALLCMIVVSPAVAQNSLTLIVWDNFTQPLEQTLLDQLDAQFQTAHPGVTIQRTAHTAAELDTLLPKALAQTTDAPDVAMIPHLNALAALLLPLTTYADQYQWGNRYNHTLYASGSESGELYTLSNTAEMVAFFYNRDMFKQLNLSIPVTWDDLEADLDTIKTTGTIPISFGNSEGWPGVDTFGALAYAYSDIQDINALLNHSPGAAFLTEGNLEAAQNFTDWISKGNFSPAFATQTNDAALAEFTSGKSVLWLANSQNSAAISAALGGDHVGFFLLPSPIGDKVAPTVGGLGLGYAIRKTSTQADLAAQYIDFITSSNTADALFDAGFLPATAVDLSKLKPNTLGADLVNAWTTINAAHVIGAPLDTVLPKIGARIQALATQQFTPETFVDQVEQDYEKP